MMSTLDDIFLLWSGTREEFEEFMKEINSMHDSIKFTCQYDYEEKSTTFLDMEVKMINGKIVTDLFRKKTDTVKYLLPSSCHPSHIFGNIPYSLALRLVRICSDPITLRKRLTELKDMLVTRKYNKNIINAAITKALSKDRLEVLEKVVKKENERVVFAIKYHPFLPSIANVLRKHWNTMVKEPRLKEIFPSPPMVAFKQHPNLQRQLCHAKLPGSNNSRTLPGMKKCLDCTACSYINVTNECT